MLIASLVVDSEQSLLRVLLCRYRIILLIIAVLGRLRILVSL